MFTYCIIRPRSRRQYYSRHVDRDQQLLYWNNPTYYRRHYPIARHQCYAKVAAVHDSSYPSVFLNAGADASFGITSPIYLSTVNSGNGFTIKNINLTAIAAASSNSQFKTLSFNW